MEMPSNISNRKLSRGDFKNGNAEVAREGVDLSCDLSFELVLTSASSESKALLPAGNAVVAVFGDEGDEGGSAQSNPAGL